MLLLKRLAIVTLGLIALQASSLSVLASDAPTTENGQIATEIPTHVPHHTHNQGLRSWNERGHINSLPSGRHKKRTTKPKQAPTGTESLAPDNGDDDDNGDDEGSERHLRGRR